MSTTTTDTPKFRPFEKQDYSCFSGVESESPMIATHEEHAIILDGKHLEVIVSEDILWLDFTSEKIALLVANQILADLVAGAGTASIETDYGMENLVGF